MESKLKWLGSSSCSNSRSSSSSGSKWSVLTDYWLYTRDFAIIDKLKLYVKKWNLTGK